MPFVPLAGMIEEFWVKPENRRVEIWVEHRDINMVMLATSLAPDGCLTLYSQNTHPGGKEDFSQPIHRP